MKSMPRTKGSKDKALTIDEQITAAKARVDECKERLDVAKAELKALESKRDEEQVKALMGAIAKNGKSVADVIALIKNTES